VTVNSRSIDDHRIWKIKGDNVEPLAADQLLGRLVYVCGVEAAGETAQLTSCRSPADCSVLAGAKDLW